MMLTAIWWIFIGHSGIFWTKCRNVSMRLVILHCLICHDPRWSDEVGETDGDWLLTWTSIKEGITQTASSMSSYNNVLDRCAGSCFVPDDWRLSILPQFLKSSRHPLIGEHTFANKWRLIILDRCAVMIHVSVVPVFISFHHSSFWSDCSESLHNC